MRLRKLAPIFCLALSLGLAAPAYAASETPTEHAANVAAAQEVAAAPVHGNVPDYSLAPDDLAKAQHLSSIHVTMHFVEEIWGVLSIVLLLALGGVAWMRDRAVGFSSNRWAQGFTFLLLYLLAGFLLSLPLDLYTQSLSLKYGLSVQSWGSWFGDAAKSLALAWLIGGLVMMLLFLVIRKFPTRWWLVFWTICIPLIFIGMFAVPAIGHLFNKYEPLAQSNPALTAKLEQVVQKGHMDIPPERMFLMKASAKVTTMNADVEGFGPSKRVVVWDTTIQKMTTDEITFVFGHESGHYVLNHIVYGLIFTLITLFIAFYLGYRFVQWAIARYGSRWGVTSQNDWAALAVLLLAFSIFGIVSEPINSAFSRHDEHAADVYGMEAIHGLVDDPQVSAKFAFDILGAGSYADPKPDAVLRVLDLQPSVHRPARCVCRALQPVGPRSDSEILSS